MARPKKRQSDTDTTRQGSNEPLLTHEEYALDAARSFKRGDRAMSRGESATIMALSIAHMNDICQGEVDLATQWQKRGREQNLDPVLYYVFAAKDRRADGTYFIPDGVIEQAAKYREANLEFPHTERVKAYENDRVVRALTMSIRRNLEVVAIIAQLGGVYHPDGNPDGVLDYDHTKAKLKVRAHVWFDDIKPAPSRMSNRELWEKTVGTPMGEEAAQGWILLDGTRGFEGSRSITALQQNARRRLHGPTMREARGPSTDEKAAEFVKAVREQSGGESVLPDAVTYVTKAVEKYAEEGTPAHLRMPLAELFVHLLAMFATEDGELDVQKVRAFWEEADTRVALKRSAA